MNLRAFFLVTTCILAACLFAVQALSMVLSKREPDLASTIFPWNGEALERKAFLVFSSTVGEGNRSLVEGASDAREHAMLAVMAHPLSPDAHAILALSAENDELKRDIVDVAYKLNRRDLNLLGLVLEHAATREDVEATTQAFDQILRVRPANSVELFDPLLEALRQPGAIPVFSDMLDGSAPWHDQFLMHALRSQSANLVLYDLRPSLAKVPDGFDEALVDGLTQQGSIDEAFRLYREALGASSAQGGAFLTWDTRFAPLGWRLKSEPGFRAIPSTDRLSLEVSIEPGKGGVIASRLIDASELPPALIFDVRGPSRDVSDNLRVELRCSSATEAFLTKALDVGVTTVTIPQDGASRCSYIYAELDARVFRSERELKAKIALENPG